MTLASQIEDDADAIMGSDGDSVTYTPNGGDATSVKAIVDTEWLQTSRTDRSSSVSTTLVIAVAKADAPNLAIGDTFAVPGEWVGQSVDKTMRVSQFVHNRSDPGIWMVQLK